MGDYIWFAMAIPVLVSVILYFFFNHKVVWWEFVIPFVLSIILILIGIMLWMYKKNKKKKINEF